jgi:hypothetical protein
MSWQTAGALKWYVRNAIYFDYGLDRRPEAVKLVRYEDFVHEPLEQCKTIFDFLGLSFNPAYAADIFDGSIRKEDFPPIDPRVEQLCEEMMNKLSRTLARESFRVLRSSQPGSKCEDGGVEIEALPRGLT